jgi:hypothetical protein
MNVVVYNPFEIISVFTAALYSGRGYQIYKSTDRIPEKAESYKFLGVSKLTTPKGIKTTLDNKEICKWYDNKIIDSDGFTIDMFSLACSELEVDSKGLGNILLHFNENKLSKQDLMLVYFNLKMAEGAIDSGIFFIPDDNLEEYDENQYYDYLTMVKRKAERNYTIQYIECGNKFYRTVVSFISDDFIWIKRLFLLGHKNIANVVATANGCAIDTTLQSINQLSVDMTCHKSNEVFIK